MARQPAVTRFALLNGTKPVFSIQGDFRRGVSFTDDRGITGTYKSKDDVARLLDRAGANVKGYIYRSGNRWSNNTYNMSSKVEYCVVSPTMNPNKLNEFRSTWQECIFLSWEDTCRALRHGLDAATMTPEELEIFQNDQVEYQRRQQLKEAERLLLEEQDRIRRESHARLIRVAEQNGCLYDPKAPSMPEYDIFGLKFQRKQEEPEEEEMPRFYIQIN